MSSLSNRNTASAQDVAADMAPPTTSSVLLTQQASGTSQLSSVSANSEEPELQSLAVAQGGRPALPNKGSTSSGQHDRFTTYLKRSALFVPRGLEPIPGCLTVSSSCITFEPDPRFELVRQKGIGQFQMFVDFSDVLQCGSISLPREENPADHPYFSAEQILHSPLPSLQLQTSDFSCDARGSPAGGSHGAPFGLECKSTAAAAGGGPTPASESGTIASAPPDMQQNAVMQQNSRSLPAGGSGGLASATSRQVDVHERMRRRETAQTYRHSLVFQVATRDILYDLTRFCLDLLDVYEEKYLATAVAGEASFGATTGFQATSSRPKKTLTTVAFGSVDSLEELVSEHSVRRDEAEKKESKMEKKAGRGVFGSILAKTTGRSSLGKNVKVRARRVSGNEPLEGEFANRRDRQRQDSKGTSNCSSSSSSSGLHAAGDGSGALAGTSRAIDVIRELGGGTGRNTEAADVVEDNGPPGLFESMWDTFFGGGGTATGADDSQYLAPTTSTSSSSSSHSVDRNSAARRRGPFDRPANRGAAGAPYNYASGTIESPTSMASAVYDDPSLDAGPSDHLPGSGEEQAPPAENFVQQVEQWRMGIRGATEGRSNVESRAVGEDLWADRRDLFAQLVSFLPLSVRFSNWLLAYSPSRHGVSLQTFYRNLHEKGPSVLFIKDQFGSRFGAFLSHCWECRGSYYGSGESFVFALPSAVKLFGRKNSNSSGSGDRASVLSHEEVEARLRTLKVYPWSAANASIQFSDETMLAVGGGGRAAIVIESDFLRGTSSANLTRTGKTYGIFLGIFFFPVGEGSLIAAKSGFVTPLTNCATFNSLVLATQEEFVIEEIEFYSFDSWD
eukprot:g17618.t1